MSNKKEEFDRLDAEFGNSLKQDRSRSLEAIIHRGRTLIEMRKLKYMTNKALIEYCFERYQVNHNAYFQCIKIAQLDLKSLQDRAQKSGMRCETQREILLCDAILNKGKQPKEPRKAINIRKPTYSKEDVQLIFGQALDLCEDDAEKENYPALALLHMANECNRSVEQLLRHCRIELSDEDAEVLNRMLLMPEWLKEEVHIR